MSLYWLTKFLSSSGGDGRRRNGVAVDDEGDLTVRQHGGAGQSGAVGHLGWERARDQLVLADEPRDGESEALVSTAHDHGVLGVGRRAAAVALGGVDDRQ